jgi:hypothetical protein
MICTLFATLLAIKCFMMKKKILTWAVAIFATTSAFAQSSEVTPKNSWLKAGVNVGVPVGDISDYSSFAAGVELKGQFMQTRNWGIGLTAGYNHFFAKDNFEDFGTVPLGVFGRYYPQSKGFFAGVDAGYSFITNAENIDGGFYLKPQVGYHNYNWNIFGFYNHTFVDATGIDNVSLVGIGATYNLRFKK